MTPVLLRTRAELRARWKAWVSLTAMLGLFGGAVIAIAAGVLLTIPATLLLANLIAYLPGRAAARVGAATVLRSE